MSSTMTSNASNASNTSNLMELFDSFKNDEEPMILDLKNLNQFCEEIQNLSVHNQHILCG